MAKGSKRPGAGRPPGSKRSLTKELLRDVVSDKDKIEILKKAVRKAKDGDKDLLKFFLEQFYGKAPQQLDNKIDGVDEIMTFRRSGKKDD